MSALNLFPARVPFTNPDGTLTNEAFRALQLIYDRIGGALGDSGIDQFANVLGDQIQVAQVAYSDVAQTTQTSDIQSSLEVTAQPAIDVRFIDEVTAQAVSDARLLAELTAQLPSESNSFSNEIVLQPPIASNAAAPGTFTDITYSGLLTGGKATFKAGTVGLPSLYLETDTATGFYRIGANNWGFSISGVKLLDLSNTGMNVTGVVTSTSLSVTGLTTLLLAGSTTSTGTGIAFPATQSPSSDANTLDDYEEGTWTPVFAGTGTAGTFTYSVQTGIYTKVGRKVTVIGQILLSAISVAPTGVMRIYGLPFTAGLTNLNSAGSIHYMENITFAANTNVTLGVPQNGVYLDLFRSISASGIGFVAAADISTTSRINFSATYFV